MITHETETTAEIAFSADTGHMTITFGGFRCTGMPPFSNELVDLARGADLVTIDLTRLQLTHPEATIEAILAALGTDETDPDIEILVREETPAAALNGSYYCG